MVGIKPIKKEEGKRKTKDSDEKKKKHESDENYIYRRNVTKIADTCYLIAEEYLN